MLRFPPLAAPMAATSLLAACLLSSVTSAQQNAPQNSQPNQGVPLQTLPQQTSYGIGLSIGANLKNDGLEVDLRALVAGIQDSLQGAEPRLTQQQLQQAFAQLEQQQMAQQQAAGQAAQQRGAAFLAANAQKQGVKMLPSGLQYKELRAGEGPSPKPTDRVRTHYRGTLIDGTEFDSSYARGEPITFPVSGVIKGWQEALPLMNVGDKWMLYVPPNLAYGERGAGGAIGPNETLIFEMELLGIE